MAKQIISNPVVIISGGTVSSNCRQATITFTADEVDTTNFGSGGYKESTGGLKSGTISFEWQNDYAAAALDATFFPLLGTVVSWEVHPASTAAVGTANPKYSGSALVTEYMPIDSAVGDLATLKTSWPTVGSYARGTS